MLTKERLTVAQTMLITLVRGLERREVSIIEGLNTVVPLSENWGLYRYLDSQSNAIIIVLDTQELKLFERDGLFRYSLIKNP